jgi:uncharacterized protein YyaL (SSP411 family)
MVLPAINHNGAMNRLATERSPYLLQHAHNPVEWFPWGEEAFRKAREDAKPIFLSIGYSTCHWCHVMERESFENESVAAVLNAHYVSVKVDREERPDVDRVYMTFVQATTGSGGWPMSVWLTPDLKPFYGGTYFPPTSRWGRPGFVEILTEIARVWDADREKVARSAESMTSQLTSMERTPAGADTVPGSQTLDRIVGQFRDAFDPARGGFGDAPKFPRPSELLFLLREHARTGNAAARDMALRTLGSMALGGMRDHIGGGFHRYSVDAAWRVPHFEKMLYDQAQLALAFAEAAQVARDAFYAEVAEDTMQYVLREMTDPAGGFYSAEDADSIPPESSADPKAHKSEGAFYLWRSEEVDRLLGQDAAIVKLRFGIEAGGNAPSDPQQEFTGKNLLYIARTVDEIAAATGRTNADVVDVLNRGRLQMFQQRLARPRPDRDDKVLTAWNGLAIAALARLARVKVGFPTSGEAQADPYLAAARRAAAFVRERLWNADRQTLLRRYRQGHAEIEAYAEDYAYLIFGLLELLQADGDPVWLEWATTLQHRQDELFWDEAQGGWFSTTGRDPTVLLRMKEDYDGAEPTASSIAVLNLMVLTHLVPDATWTARIDRTLRFFASRLEQVGRGVPMMAAALSTFQAGVEQIVIATGDGTSGPAAGESIEREVALRYWPFAVVLHVDAESRQRLASRLPFVSTMRAIDGKTTIYRCRDFTCRQPVTTMAALDEQLDGTRR